jgi:hypothetical protein
MNIPFKVICIHDEDRINEIPLSKWVVKGKEYTVIKVERMFAQGGAIGYELEELDLSSCFPYTRFGAWRFAIPLSQFIEETKKEEVPEELELEAL